MADSVGIGLIFYSKFQDSTEMRSNDYSKGLPIVREAEQRALARLGTALAIPRTAFKVTLKRRYDMLKEFSLIRAQVPDGIEIGDSGSAAVEEERQVNWPSLVDVGLSRRRIANRRSGIGGSDANVILSGNSDLIIALWREKRGEQSPEDLTNVLPVMMGTWTEDFNRQWFERVTNQSVSCPDESLRCETHDWRRCSLDGFIADRGAVWEAKHTGAFTKSDEVLERYMPQLQHNMAVAKSDFAVLSVIFGNHKFEIFEVASDWIYQLELLDAELDFWDCVQTGREPVPFAPPAPPRPVGVREVCLEGNNLWAAAAADWGENKVAAKIHAAACGQIKQLVEPDVSRAFGHGIEAKRSKSGAISIRELAL